MSQENQIFQTSSAFRWNSIKWTTRIILVIAIFLISVVIVAVVQGTSPALTIIKTNNGYFKDDKESSKALKLSMSQKFKGKGFKTFLESKDREDSINKAKVSKKVDKLSNCCVCVCEVL